MHLKGQVFNQSILAGTLLVVACAQAKASETYSLGCFSKENWILHIQDESIGKATPSWISEAGILRKTGNKNCIPVPALEKGSITFASKLTAEAYFRVVFTVLDRHGDDGGQLFVAEQNKSVRCLTPKEKHLDNVHLAPSQRTIFITGDHWPERKSLEGKGAGGQEGVASPGL